MSDHSITDKATSRTEAGEIDITLGHVASALRPGWVVLHGCAFGSDRAAPAARVQYALIHPHVGIALLDFLPGTKGPAVVDQLREALDAAEFPKAFSGHPPIAHLRLKARSLPGLGARLDRAFDTLPPLALQGGDAWVAIACRVLGGQLTAVTTASLSAARGGIGGARSPLRPPAALSLFWSALLLSLAGGAAVLQDPRVPHEHTTAKTNPSPARKRASDAVAADVWSDADRADHASIGPQLSRAPIPALPQLEEATAAIPRVRASTATETGGARSAHGFERVDPAPSLGALLRELGESAPPMLGSTSGYRLGSAAGAEAPVGGSATSDIAAYSGPLGADSAPPGGPATALAAASAAHTRPGADQGFSAVSHPAPLTPIVSGSQRRVPQTGPAPSELSASILEVLMRRGDAMVASGDISAARMLYARAAAAGVGRAAAALGQTYDPTFLAGMNAAIQGDPAMAEAWYRRADALGDHRAKERLARHGVDVTD